MTGIEHVRLSQQAKEQLIRVKRVTGIEHWNVLCRWAFCISLAENTKPSASNVVTGSNVEMTWRVFGGRHSDLYLALLKERCLSDGLTTAPDVLALQFRLHLHRGISYLAAKREIRAVDDLVALALATA